MEEAKIIRNFSTSLTGRKMPEDPKERQLRRYLFAIELNDFFFISLPSPEKICCEKFFLLYLPLGHFQWGGGEREVDTS